MVGNIVKGGVYLPSVDFFSQTIYQPLPLPFLLTPKLPLTKSVSQPPSHPSVISHSTTSEPPLDFSSPAEFIPCLDTSAARHRVSIKPRNQRASTKKRVLTVRERFLCLTCYEDKPKRCTSWISVLLFLHRVSLSLICPPKTMLRGPSLCKRKMLLLRRRCCLIRTKRKKISLLHLSVSVQNSQMNQTPHPNHRA